MQSKTSLAPLNSTSHKSTMDFSVEDAVDAAVEKAERAAAVELKKTRTTYDAFVTILQEEADRLRTTLAEERVAHAQEIASLRAQLHSSVGNGVDKNYAAESEEFFNNTEEDETKTASLSPAKKQQQSAKTRVSENRTDAAAETLAMSAPVAGSMENYYDGKVENDRAAAKLQAAQRGKAVRSGAPAKRKAKKTQSPTSKVKAQSEAKTSKNEADSVVFFADVGADEGDAAASKLQAIQRGQTARRDVVAKRASKMETEASSVALGIKASRNSGADGVAAPVANQADSVVFFADVGVDEGDAAASKLQAIQRGQAARRDVASKRTSSEELGSDPMPLNMRTNNKAMSVVDVHVERNNRRVRHDEAATETSSVKAAEAVAELGADFLLPYHMIKSEESIKTNAEDAEFWLPYDLIRGPELDADFLLPYHLLRTEVASSNISAEDAEFLLPYDLIKGSLPP